MRFYKKRTITNDAISPGAPSSAVAPTIKALNGITLRNAKIAISIAENITLNPRIGKSFPFIINKTLRLIQAAAMHIEIRKISILKVTSSAPKIDLILLTNEVVSCIIVYQNAKAEVLYE